MHCSQFSVRGRGVGGALCEWRGQGAHFFLVGAVVCFDSVSVGGRGSCEGRGECWGEREGEGGDGRQIV